MKRQVILDTGPLVALLNAGDQWHDWTQRQLAEIAPPLLTCEAVLAEACFVMQNAPAATRNGYCGNARSVW